MVYERLVFSIWKFPISHSSPKYYYAYYKTSTFSFPSPLCPHTFQSSQMQHGEYTFSEDTTSTFFRAGCIIFNKNKFQSQVRAKHFPHSLLPVFFFSLCFSVSTVGLQGLPLLPKWLSQLLTVLDFLISVNLFFL